MCFIQLFSCTDRHFDQDVWSEEVDAMQPEVGTGMGNWMCNMCSVKLCLHTTINRADLGFGHRGEIYRDESRGKLCHTDQTNLYYFTILLNFDNAEE